MSHCRNCGVYGLRWGVVCGDCVRAVVLGALGAIGGWLIQVWVRS